MGSMRNLAKFLFGNRAFHRYEDFHADNARIDTVIGDDVHVEVFEFFLHGVHLGFAPPEPRELVSDDHIVLAASRGPQKLLIARTIYLVAGPSFVAEFGNCLKAVTVA